LAGIKKFFVHKRASERKAVTGVDWAVECSLQIASKVKSKIFMLCSGVMTEENTWILARAVAVPRKFALYIVARSGS